MYLRPFILLFLTCWLSLLCVVQGELPSEIRLGYMNLPFGPNESDVAAVYLARDRLVQDGLIKNGTIQIFTKYLSRFCNGFDESIAFLDLVLNNSISGLIGPSCSASGGEVIGRLAVSWNMLVVSHLTMQSVFANKNIFRTYGRTTLTSTNQFAKAFIQVLKHFGWTNIGIIVESNTETGYVLPALKEAIKAHGINIRVLIDFDPKKPDYETMFNTLKQNCRIIVPVLGWHMKDTKELMLEAHRANMTGPDFMWIQLQISTWGTFDWSNELTQSFNTTAIIELEALNYLYLKDFFVEMEIMYRKLFPEKPIGSYGGTQYQAALFDAAYMHGVALNLSVAANVSYNDGLGLFNLLKWKRVDQGATAAIIFDGDVERVPTYLVKSVNTQGEWIIHMKLDRVPNYTDGTYGFVVEYTNDNLPRWITDPPLNIPLCGYTGQLCLTADNSLYYGLGIAAFVLVTIMIPSIYYINKQHYERQLMGQNWRLDPEKFVQDPTMKLFASRRTFHTEAGSVGGGGMSEEKLQSISSYENNMVYSVLYKKIKSFHFSRAQLQMLMKFKTNNNQHLNRLYGFNLDDSEHLYVVWNYPCIRTLRDTLQNMDIKLDYDFIASFISSVVHGLKYIHESTFHWHGYLTSDTCLVDSRFVVRLSQYGITGLLDESIRSGNLLKSIPKNDLLHMAPEIITEYLQDKSFIGSQKADIYSAAMVLYQIITRNELFEMTNANSLQDLLGSITNPNAPYRPSFDRDVSTEWRPLETMIHQCWERQPDRRPNTSMLFAVTDTVTHKFSGNVIENMIKRLEKYSSNLEHVVADRTEELEVEKAKAVQLLEQMLPKSVADRLRAGLGVEPEWFSESTVMFCDIVNFTSISSERPAIEIVALLNQLFGKFDEIVEKRNVYKVETIGDAYMVVSGVPQVTPNHAKEIGLLALDMKDMVKAFIPPFKKKMTAIETRIGVHSGPVAAGVVGAKMPRYCLFGDTVNTAARMESHGTKMKIQVSANSQKILEQYADFQLELRGDIEVKGKGLQTTYYLEKTVAVEKGKDIKFKKKTTATVDDTVIQEL